MKWIKRFNENYGEIDGEVKRDFNTTIYSSVDKSIIGAYYLLSESDKSYKVLNVREEENKTKRRMDGTLFYHLYPSIINLPKSNVKIDGEVEDKPGFYWFKIPYWIFKSSDDLKIMRLKIDKKEFDFSRSQVLFNEITDATKKIFTNPQVVEYIKNNYDGGELKTLRSYIDVYKN